MYVFLSNIDCELITINATSKNEFIHLRYKYQSDSIIEYYIRQKPLNNDDDKTDIIKRIEIKSVANDMDWHLKTSAY